MWRPVAGHLWSQRLFIAERQHFRGRKKLRLGDFGKLGDDVFGHAVAEVFVFLRIRHWLWSVLHGPAPGNRSAFAVQVLKDIARPSQEMAAIITYNLVA
jgi:hypothetical protein